MTKTTLDIEAVAGDVHVTFCVPGEDEEEMEQQEEEKEQVPEAEGSAEAEPGSDHGNATPKTSTGQPCLRRLFTFSLVNVYGTADINSLTTDGKLLKLNCKHFL